MEIDELINSNGTLFVKSKPHPFLAGVSDFYFLTSIFAIILGLTSSLAARPVPGGLKTMLTMSLLALTIVIIYHKFFSKNVLWLSPGELLVGRAKIQGKKEWTNPYNRNRFIDFLFSILTLIVLGNEWDKLSQGHVFTINEAITKSLKVISFSVILVLYGQRKFSKKKVL